MPSNFRIFAGNHLETLALALSRLICIQQTETAPDALEPEIILVQSKGMQRWLSMAIARHNGICANMDFPFPNRFLEQTYENVMGALPQTRPYDPQSMAFAIMERLDGLLDRDAFAPIRHYLSGPGRPLKKYQLAGKIADVFDQYLVFRPDLIRRWESNRSLSLQGGAERWQARLWSTLTQSFDAPHRAELQNTLVARLSGPTDCSSGLPGRVSVFGISHLPVFHLEVLSAVSRHIPVNIFLFNPCRQFWSDIVSERHMTKKRSALSSGSPAFEDLHFERGNRLLASWGHQGRQFFSLLHQIDGETTELFEDNDTGTLLGHIQQDILDLVDRPAVSQPSAACAPDGSIRVQSCHSPMREVEVLCDQLLDILESNPEINPSDILVMTPDISIYAPLIHAVFGGLNNTATGGIPYTVADQNVPAESRVAQAFIALLDLHTSRYEASRVMSLLEFDCIRCRFGLHESDLLMIEQWLSQVNIRWGWDSRDRGRHGLPRFEQNTWRNGLDRLLLGYAVQSREDALIAGLLPHRDGVEGADSNVLGQFILFAETLHGHLARLPATASLKDWSAHFLSLIDLFFQDDSRSGRDLELLRSVVAKMEQISRTAARDSLIGFEVVRQYIMDSLARSSFGGGFMAGGVTFCAMLPMRSIPADVIALLGMQHDAFPKENHEPGFNLILEKPRPGDRSKRNDDQYLFLEALLSSRRIFYISYVGRDVQDNSPIPPSVLVSELLEYIDGGFAVARHQLVTEQPLQPFSPKYFSGENRALFSYSEENCEAAGHLSVKPAPTPFFAEPLPAPDSGNGHVSLSTLIDFFSHPVKFLLENRLGIRPSAAPQPAEDRESFNLDGLQKFLISETLLNARLPFATIRAAGDLPHGTCGKAVFDQLNDQAAAFLHRVERYRDDSVPKDMAFDYFQPPFHISGTVTAVSNGGRLVYRMAKTRPRQLMDCYINHLALNLLEGEQDTARQTILVCKDNTWRFKPTDRAAELLDDLLQLYRQGLSRPLTVLPLSSFEFARRYIMQGKSRHRARAAAQRQWLGGSFQDGECDDAYLGLVFGHGSPFTQDFEDCALQLYTSLFATAQPVDAD